MNRLVVCALACTLSLVSSALSLAQAQTVGTFRWQLQPYCNVITATITQSGGVYTVDGTDDLCGANPRAAVTGLAFLNANGTVSFGLSLVVPPSPTAIQLTATIDIGSLGGTWQDSAGNTGAFAFNPAAASGSPRPAAMPVFTAGLSAGGGRINNVGTPTASTDAANRAYVDSAVAAAAAGLHVVNVGSNEWQPFTSADPFDISRFSTNTRFIRTVTGTNFLSIAPNTPVALYGKSLQLEAVEFCYEASTNAVLSYVEVNLIKSVDSVGSRTLLFSDGTNFTNTACRYIALSAPVPLTADDSVNLFVNGSWTSAGVGLRLGRASFVFRTTTTPLTPPSDAAPSTAPMAPPQPGPSTLPPQP